MIFFENFKKKKIKKKEMINHNLLCISEIFCIIEYD